MIIKYLYVLFTNIITDIIISSAKQVITLKVENAAAELGQVNVTLSVPNCCILRSAGAGDQGKDKETPTLTFS